MAARAATKLAPPLRELRIHLCQRSAASQGVRDFIESSYVGLKQANPKFPILIRECSGVQPKAWARYDLGKEASVSLEGLSSGQVGEAIQKLAQGK
ncbi:NADH dehydrogenase [ubiquinone] 1 alpha subcomplex subunit 2-like [Penaeus monodon]|uniref:NADH dehydrogenase [ubiquinone] 1 alpha subcomplex subunit 2-like n=1 Tax=Penaeus monodon TaxID=6687 RepID=UPI0018A6DABA|nr:NADH dehydrogenase [ubiquinone] 1 alpha subcomplex subunit 2-like [Penaeus monodon]XP_037796613.1 NADH dehydrogenase [ubiquinone] 1 alpha subcomplex subunit 2-like [Penaeus monodon]